MDEYATAQRAAAGGRAIDAADAATFDKAMENLEREKEEDLRRFLSKEMPYEEQIAYVKYLNSELARLHELHQWYTQCIQACVGSKAREQRNDAKKRDKAVRRDMKKISGNLDTL